MLKAGSFSVGGGWIPKAVPIEIVLSFCRWDKMRMWYSSVFQCIPVYTSRAQAKQSNGTHHVYEDQGERPGRREYPMDQGESSALESNRPWTSWLVAPRSSERSSERHPPNDCRRSGVSRMQCALVLRIPVTTALTKARSRGGMFGPNDNELE